MSLDGFIAGPEHSIEWAFDAFKDAAPNRRGEGDQRDRAIPGGRSW
jgi:hypothetical protein